MTDAETLKGAVRAAWSTIPAPPAEDLAQLAWECGEDAWREFAGVAPMDVDTRSPAFLGCTPLMHIPPTAAAAYFGTYAVALMESMQWQERNVVFYDILIRAHTLHCLGDAEFWQRVLRPHLTAECRTALLDLCAYVVRRRELLGLTQDRADAVADLARS